MVQDLKSWQYTCTGREQSLVHDSKSITEAVRVLTILNIGVSHGEQKSEHPLTLLAFALMWSFYVESLSNTPAR